MELMLGIIQAPRPPQTQFAAPFPKSDGKHLVSSKNTSCGGWSVKSDELVPECGVQGFVGRRGA